MGQVDTNYIIIGGASVIILSYFFNILAKKTSIPSVLMLILIGTLFNLALSDWLDLNLFKDKNYTPLLSVLGTVGLILIVLEASLDLKLEKSKLPIIYKSLLIAFLGVMFCTALIAVIFHTIVVQDWIISIMYAIPLAIISSAIVIPSIGNLMPEKKEFLIYESAFSDIIGIMVFYFFKDNVGKSSAIDVVGNITWNIGLTLVISVIAGYVLIIILQKLTTHVKFFLLISVLFLVYACGKLMHLSPLLVIMFFGIIINNDKLFFKGFLKKWLNEGILHDILHEMKLMTAETAFLVRTFFFFIFGLSIIPSSLYNLDVIMLSLLVLAAIYFVRVILFASFARKDSSPQSLVSPRGLITILLFFQIPEKFRTDNFNSGVLLVVILVTSLVMTLALIQNRKRTEALQTTNGEGENIDISDAAPQEPSDSASGEDNTSPNEVSGELPGSSENNGSSGPDIEPGKPL